MKKLILLTLITPLLLAGCLLDYGEVVTIEYYFDDQADNPIKTSYHFIGDTISLLGTGMNDVIMYDHYLASWRYGNVIEDITTEFTLELTEEFAAEHAEELVITLVAQWEDMHEDYTIGNPFGDDYIGLAYNNNIVVFYCNVSSLGC